MNKDLLTKKVIDKLSFKEVKVEIIPKSHRAKNRVREQGKIMVLKSVDSDGIRVESLDKTFTLTGLDGKKEKIIWGGWFTKEEADYKEI